MRKAPIDAKPRGEAAERTPEAALPAGNVPPLIRQLTRADLPQVTAHFLRLEKTSRRLRFGRPVSDAFLIDYAEKIFETFSIVFGAEIDGTIRGVTEIRGASTAWTAFAEAAISVEDDWQDRGIGSALLKRLVLAARNRGIAQIYMVCLAENRKMKHLALKHEAILDYCVDEVESRIVNLRPSLASLVEEWMDEVGEAANRMVTAPLRRMAASLGRNGSGPGAGN